jgi:hypothetical protein
MAQPMDVVWWQLFQSVGRDWSLAAVREWTAPYQQQAREIAVEHDDTVELG